MRELSSVAKASMATARALTLLTLARALRHSLSIHQKQRALRALSHSVRGSKTPRRIVSAHRRAAKVYGSNVLCLDRALALWSDLESADLNPLLRFGVTHDPTFEAHAWVELEGKALNEDANHLARFSPFDDELAERWFQQAKR